MLYESLLVSALLFVATGVYLFFRDPQAPGGMVYFRLYLLFVTSGYFLWFWTHGGQTLAMKTWRVRLATADGQPLRAGRAVMRLFLASVGLLFFGIGILWAFFDPERQFLHDRLAGTRLILCESSA